MQVKPADADRFLDRPDPAIRLVLVYGPDDGLVAERVARFVKAVTGKGEDPFSHVRLETDQIADDPARLSDEAHSISMFGGSRAISVRLAGNRSIIGSLEAILEKPPVDSWIVISAGDLKKTAPVRKLCESDKRAAAVPCYVDNARDLDRVIDEETRSAGLTISNDARQLLRSLIGSDRLASRGDIEKLCLYAAEAGTITGDDVRAVVGDAASFDIDETVLAVFDGDTALFDRGYRRLVAGGTPGFVLAGAAQRHAIFLHRARTAFEAGDSAREIVERARPPIFFQRRAATERQIERWPLARVERALALLEQAVIDSRLRSAISDEAVAQALTLIAASAAPRRG
jgi:DNA polymerase-3 subunit delta